MGNLPGWRYSSLTQINKSNVATLKEAWHINLGTARRRTPRAARSRRTPSSPDGTYYIHDPKGDVFALDAATGARSGSGRPRTRPASTSARAGRQPGVAIGEGKVFDGLRDGYIYALDQMTGELLWKTEVAPWRKGGKVSTAPIYVNGIVLVGDSAGDNGGVSASMHAYDGEQRQALWTWSVIPAVGQPGGNTWPANPRATNNSTYGGGSMWESPIVDTKRGLAIFGTGNPKPWNSRGPGMNLCTDSIVALNLYTGQLVWGYQTTHHDLWDSDLPNNGVMFTGQVQASRARWYGRVPGVAYVNKYGMTFILDRETGKPLLPIPEEKVPQSTAPDVNTWPTQPIPMADNVLFNKLRRRTGGPARTATSRRPTRTCRSRRRPRPTASRTRSVARTTRTTRRSTSCSRSR